jgi:hypothetical protein
LRWRWQEDGEEQAGITHVNVQSIVLGVITVLPKKLRSTVLLSKIPELRTRGGKVCVRLVWVCRGEWGRNGVPCGRCRGEACAPHGRGQGRWQVVNREEWGVLGVLGLWNACAVGCRCCMCTCFSVLGSTLHVWCCGSTRADTPAVQICEFDARACLRLSLLMCAVARGLGVLGWGLFHPCTAPMSLAVLAHIEPH